MKLSPRAHDRLNATLTLVAAGLFIACAYAGKRVPSAPAVADTKPVFPARPPFFLFGDPSLRPLLKLPPAKPRYSIHQGAYRQAGVAEPRHLVVESEGKGQLVLDFGGIPALVVGANRVVIETTWEVEEDDVVFTLHGGNPPGAYRRVLDFALEEVTRFHITAFGEESLTLVRASDGEVFRWVRVAED